MIGRRGLLVAPLGHIAGTSVPALASPVELGVDSAVPMDHAVPGARLGSLALRVWRAGGPVFRAGEEARHGFLARGAPFDEAPLFAGLPFGMGAAELRNWLSSAAGRQMWDAGWAHAGFHALPCAVLQVGHWNGATLPFAFGQVIEWAMPLNDWAALPAKARDAIRLACNQGMAVTGVLPGQGRALTAAASAALAADTAARLRLEVPQAARRAYAAARHVMLC
jgi:hypothetical protein